MNTEVEILNGEIEQQENSIPQKNNNKKEKLLLFISLILNFCLLCIVVYLFFLKENEQKQDNLEQENAQTNDITESLDKSLINFIYYNGEDNLIVKLDYLGEFKEAGDPIYPSHRIFTVDTGPSTDFEVSFYPDRDIMIKSLADNEFLEYKDLEKVEGITDSYYLKREVACKDCAPTGTIISWTPTTMVKGYEAIYTTSYYNIVNLAEGKTDYNIDSYTEETGKKCIINLSQISEKEGGYLVFYGMASAGSYINYCEMLEEMDTFEIVIEKVTEPN